MRQSRRTTTPQAVDQRGEPKPPDCEDADFLNIDLEVRSRRALDPLVAAWPWSYQPLIAEGRVDRRWLIPTPRRIGLNAEAAVPQSRLRRRAAPKASPENLESCRDRRRVLSKSIVVRPTG